MLLNFKEYGQGKPLIILHGLFGSLDNWATLARQLGNHFRVITMDLRNHGNSPHSDDWNYELMAADVLETMHSLSIPKAYLAGHSMGGKTVMVFADLFPECVEKIMVIDIAPRYYKPHHQEILEALFSVDLNLIRSRKEAEEKLMAGISDIASRQFLLKNLYWISDQQLAWKFNLKTIAEKIEIVGEASPADGKMISLPALFVKGEKSAYIKKEDEDKIKNRFTHAEIIEIEGAGHWIHAEKPAELLECFIHFFH